VSSAYIICVPPVDRGKRRGGGGGWCFNSVKKGWVTVVILDVHRRRREVADFGFPALGKREMGD